MKLRLVAGAAGMLLTLPAGSAAQERVELTATTSLSGNVNGYVPVRLSREARASSLSTEAATVGRIQSDSRVAGAILRAEPAASTVPDPETEDVPETLVFWRALPQAGEFVFGSHPAPSNSEFLLRAGDYRLYLITDGAESTVTLTLRGLDGGSRSLRPTFATPATLGDPPPLKTGPPTWTFGSSRQATSDGWVMAQLRVQTDGYGAGHREICIQPDEQAASYDSGCSGDGSGMSRDHVVGPGETVMSYSRWVFRPGQYAVGGNTTLLSSGAIPHAPEMRAALVSFSPATPLTSEPAADPPAPPATPHPLPVVEKRSVKRTRGGIRVRLRCRAASDCSGYIRLGNGRRRRVWVPTGRRVSITLPGTVKGRRAWVAVEALTGSQRVRVRVTVRRSAR